MLEVGFKNFLDSEACGSLCIDRVLHPVLVRLGNRASSFPAALTHVELPANRIFVRIDTKVLCFLTSRKGSPCLRGGAVKMSSMPAISCAEFDAFGRRGIVGQWLGVFTAVRTPDLETLSHQNVFVVVNTLM